MTASRTKLHRKETLSFVFLWTFFSEVRTAKWWEDKKVAEIWNQFVNVLGNLRTDPAANANNNDINKSVICLFFIYCILHNSANWKSRGLFHFVWFDFGLCYSTRHCILKIRLRRTDTDWLGIYIYIYIHILCALSCS